MKLPKQIKFLKWLSTIYLVLLQNLHIIFLKEFSLEFFPKMTSFLITFPVDISLVLQSAPAKPFKIFHLFSFHWNSFLEHLCYSSMLLPSCAYRKLRKLEFITKGFRNSVKKAHCQKQKCLWKMNSVNAIAVTTSVSSKPGLPNII